MQYGTFVSNLLLRSLEKNSFALSLETPWALDSAVREVPEY